MASQQTEHDTDPAPPPVEVRSLEGRELLRQWQAFTTSHLESWNPTSP